MTTENSSTDNASDREYFQADHRKRVREWELAQVVTFFPPGCRVLEVGAGAGWQAKRLAEQGFSVTAIDIAQSRYNRMQEWEVIDYDGHHIPLPDASIDVIFSSNVLEHIPHIEEFMGEMRRVLRPGGVAVHVMPTTLWRVLTCVTFYIQRLKLLIGKLMGKRAPAAASENGEGGSKPGASSGILAKLRHAGLPTLHGVRGNVLTEHYYFSNAFWEKTFTAGGWTIASRQGAGLLYSGYRVFASAFPFSLRRSLAQVLGSSCRIYIAYPSKP